MKRLKRTAVVFAGLALFGGILVGVADGQYESVANVDNYNYATIGITSNYLDKYYMDEIFPMVGGEQFTTANVSYLQAVEPYSEFSLGTMSAYLSPSGFRHRTTIETFPDDYTDELRNKIASSVGQNVMAYCDLIVPISELKNPYVEFQKYMDKIGAPLEDKEAHELRIKENEDLGLPITFNYARDYIGAGMVAENLQVSAAVKGSAVRDSITKLNAYCGVTPENLESAESFVLEEFITEELASQEVKNVGDTEIE